MPWPVRSAPWSPAAVHQEAPAPRAEASPALLLEDTIGPRPADGVPVPVADRHLIETATQTDPPQTDPRRAP